MNESFNQSICQSLLRAVRTRYLVAGTGFCRSHEQGASHQRSEIRAINRQRVLHPPYMPTNLAIHISIKMTATFSACTSILLLLLPQLGESFCCHNRLCHFKANKGSRKVISSLFAREEDGSEETVAFDPNAVNVLGTQLRCCCADVGGTGMGTGFYRNGYCSTGEEDLGRHTVCCQVTDKFLEFSKVVGNDLSTPAPDYLFPGLKEGDIWCLCAQRWAQAHNAGMAPKLFLQATHEKTLDYAPIEVLKNFAVDKEEAEKILKDLDDKREQLNNLL